MYFGASCKIIRFAAVLAACAFELFLFDSAWAQSVLNLDFTQHEKLKTVTLGFGGAYRALADSNAGMLVNPAGIAQRKGVMTASADYVKSGFMNSTLISGSVIDFKATDMLALGLEYDRNMFSVANDVALNQITLGAATDIGQILYIGANLKGYFATVNSPFIADPNGVDMDVGFLVKPISMVSLALTLENMFQGSSKEEYPLIMGFGAGLTLTPMARFDIDLTRNFNTSSSQKLNSYFGGEIRAAEGIFLRGGFGLDQVQDNNFYAVGLVIAGPAVSLNFTYSERLNPKDSVFAGNAEFSF